ncbi:SH3 domain-binding protein 5 homolog isoform X2 [Oppia nitens]|uniref:SH3 domain-binding protein 5 homolog isoform X2 n=1 Tax=Oppia nitens TaxID=1686743 RepID=UPI0023DACBCF|nr:SH3 domain-binding protein 5 homolog isoform X2 [Oppia nitens]
MSSDVDIISSSDGEYDERHLRRRALSSAAVAATAEDNDEQLDPRIRDKLEELNECTNRINKLEKQFEESNSLFRQTLTNRTMQLQMLAKKLGNCVPEARPYYECRQRVAELQTRCQTAVQTYERSAELHSESKELITIAEHKFAVSAAAAATANSSRAADGTDFDHFWQEMLNHANTKFMEAKTMKTMSQSEHSQSIQNYLDEQKRLTRLERQLRSAIKKAKPYYEESAAVQTELNSIKAQIERLNKVIFEAKKSYAKTLKDLEKISEEIHERRAQLMAKLLTREPGVGAEREDNSNCDDDCENRLNVNQESYEDNKVPDLDQSVELNDIDIQVMASHQSPNGSSLALSKMSPIGKSATSSSASSSSSALSSSSLSSSLNAIEDNYSDRTASTGTDVGVVDANRVMTSSTAAIITTTTTTAITQEVNIGSKIDDQTTVYITNSGGIFTQEVADTVDNANKNGLTN